VRGAVTVRSLERAVRGTVVDDAVALAAAGRDGSHLVGRPCAVVAPADAADVAALVRWARRRRVPLVPRGAGTSLDGESVPADGAVVVDFGAWDHVLEVSEEGRWVRVEPGVVNARLHEVLRPHGLFFPPNPGSWQTSTVGGNLGTNASGPRSFRYGPTRRWVLEAEVVLGTGERVRLGSRAAKRSVGPDLLQVFIGSEGTLGIATEVTLRLAPTPRVRRGLVIPLPPRVRLGALAVRLAHVEDSGLSAVEYLDRYSAEGLTTSRAAPWPGRTALLLLEVEASGEREADARTKRIRRTLRASGVNGPVRLFPDADRLWDLRGESGRVMDEELGSRIREDVAVPPARVDDLLRSIRRICAREGVAVYTFAHLGEGSLHPNITVDPSSPAAERVRAALYREALRWGGTISAEHGVGRLKRKYLEREVGPVAVRLLRAVRAACDPDGILNPGKLYPPTGAGAGSSRSPSGSGAARTSPG
jgi:FAD/FMN-containing dehydrogenase